MKLQRTQVVDAAPIARLDNVFGKNSRPYLRQISFSDFTIRTGGGFLSGATDMHSETELMLKGHGLVTAEITYRMPDFRSILQTFVWQDYDLAPKFPKMRSFLDFWQNELDGPLHSVRYTHQNLIKPGEWRNVCGEFVVH